MRGLVTETGAQSITPAAATLYQAGGHRILSDPAKHAVKTIATRHATRVAREGTSTAATPGGLLTSMASRAVGKVDDAVTVARVTTAASTGGKTAAQAARTIASGIGRTAAFGGVVDGAIATGEATYRCVKGQWDTEDAVMHVAGETATGAASAGAGVAAAAGFVALTGAVAAPAVAAVAVGTAIGTKIGLVRMWNRFTKPADTTPAQPPPPPSADTLLPCAV